MIERLHYFGATHRTAAITVREKLAPGPQRLPGLLSALRKASGEALVLSTCGRFEVYLASPEEGLVDDSGGLAAILNLPPELARRHLHSMAGRDAARHALRVAAGLDSRLIGEDQILAQVRSAFSLARREKACGPLLSALFQTAIHGGRQVRSETRLGHRGRSYAALAVSAAAAQLEHLDVPCGSPAVIVLGTGALARDVSDEIRRRSVAGLLIVGRHLDRVRALAAQYRGEPHGLDELPALLRRAGVLVACATTEAPLVTRDMIPASGGRLLIDLGMPRNIEQTAGDLPGVTLMHLDTMRGDSAIEREAIDEAERRVDVELARYERWLAGRAAAPRIVRILDRAGAAPGGASPELRRALHKRIIRLKEDAAA